MINITLFTTGGTIDGVDVKNVHRKEISDAAQWLSSRSDIRLITHALFNKDSREINPNDRALLIKAVQGCTDDRILITHGTFTIAETGKSLKRSLGNLDKSILLVGAWIPFSHPNSDAPQQMAFAFEQLKLKRAGVYIAMDNRLWDPYKTIKKEVRPGYFELQETVP